MLSEQQMINRYGAKFFIGSLVRVIKSDGLYPEDIGLVGVIQGIVGSQSDGFEYTLWPTETTLVAWFKEEELEFVNKLEKQEFDAHFVRKGIPS